jgi:hypothetical protein
VCRAPVGIRRSAVRWRSGIRLHVDFNAPLRT